MARGTGKITTLFLVDGNPGIRPSVVAQIILKDRSAMGRLVDQMEEHGLLRRGNIRRRQPRSELYITEKGSELAAHIRGLVTKQSRDFFSDITDEEHGMLIGILRRVYRRIVAQSRTA